MISYESFKELVLNRRSKFPQTFTDEKVPDQDIIDLLELANWAPNHKKTEPWRFKIFTDNSLQGLSDLFVDYYQQNTPAEKQSAIKLKKLQNRPLQCSHVICIIVKRSTEVKIPEWEEIAAVSCAVQNFWLGCATKGIGTYWSSPSAAIKNSDLLDLEEDDIYLGQLYVGKVDASLKSTATRGDISEKISWVRD